ncbi:MAG: ribonuclease [Solirubrobacteraceae bacterium]|nr:ribonuclease [Solirubrobacteraceae bacterium]
MRLAHPTTRAELRALAGDVVDGFAEHRLLTYASAIAYQVLSALIPLALFALALAGILNLEGLWTHHLRPDLLKDTSTEVFNLVDKTVNQILRHKQTFWATFGLLVVLWELGGAVRATMEALDEIYAVKRKRTRTDKYVTSTWLAAAVGALWLATFAVLLVGGRTIGGPLGTLASYVVAALLLTVATGLTVRIAPAEHLPAKWVSVGSLVIVAGWLIVVGGYVLYATSIASYTSVFGSLAAAFVLIVAVYLSAVVFLTGVLIDAKARDES